MKSSICILWVIILILLMSCAPQAGQSAPIITSAVTSGTQTSKSSVRPEPTVPHIVAIPSTPRPTASPSPTLIPDKDIPNVIIDPANKANSTYSLYEDEKNIYYIWKVKPYRGDLLMINKNDGSIRSIANDCSKFAVYNDKIYHNGYNAEVDTCSKEITEYNMNTGVSKVIVSLDYPIYQLASYGKELYFARRSEIILDSGESYDNIYSASLNGSNIKKIQEDAHSFCIYDDRLFYVNVGGADGGLLYECDFDSVSAKKLIYTPSVDWNFDISHNKVVLNELMGNCFIYDISSSDEKELPFIRYYHAIAGQYILYFEYNEDNAQTLISAYDFLAEKKYILWDISKKIDGYTSVDIHTSGENIYICLNNLKKDTLDMYRLNIRNGKAVTEHVVSLGKEN